VAIQEKYRAALAPANSLEAALVDDIVLAQWRARRMQRVEETLLRRWRDMARLSVRKASPRADDLRLALGYYGWTKPQEVLPMVHRRLETLSREYNTAVQNLIALRKAPAPCPLAKTQAKRNAAKSICTKCKVVAIDDPRYGRKPSQPSSRPPEPQTAPEREAA
jgi:hypothetical protein